MGVISEALAKLAAVTVPGVTSYALAAAPEQLGTAQLPALVIVPEWGGEAAGLTPSVFSAGDGRVTVRVVHALLVAPVTSGSGLHGNLPEVVDLVDATLAALAADPLLGEALPSALQCGVAMGVVRYGGIDYHGARFTHTWTLHVTGS